MDSPKDWQIKELAERIVSKWSVDRLRRYVEKQFVEMFEDNDPEIFWKYLERCDEEDYGE